jgi:16S rRNA (guanine(527)-N(7))-methyltransferase RsmG
MPESEKALKLLIQESGIATDPVVPMQLQAYLALLIKWNSRINLTSSTEWDVVGPLFQEGIWASRLYADHADHHLDIGSGAGFPAVVLKILKARIRLDLVESRTKKGIFLETAVDVLGLSGIRVHSMRIQKFLQQCDPKKTWDCISWKALKLSNNDIRMLLAHAGAATQFWMFHGGELAVEEPAMMDQYFRLYRTERFPGRMLWSLSIYLPK